MPGTDGLAATTAICADPGLSATRVLILTTFETDEYVARALRAGASGFLGKDVSADGLLAGIRTVAAGDALLSPQATRALIARFLTSPAADHVTGPGALADLTAREREVMALAAQGCSNDDIAPPASTTPSTRTCRRSWSPAGPVAQPVDRTHPHPARHDQVARSRSRPARRHRSRVRPP